MPPYSATCGRSDAAYAVQIDGRMRIDLDDFVACAGATTSTMLATQMGALDADTDLVTVSIGGNDIGWGNVVGACVAAGDALCAGAIAATTGAITNVLPSLLDATYTQIAAAAPDAHVVVTGYPRLFSPEYGAYYNASPAEQQAMNDGADLLNSVIAEAAAEFGFQFVDVTSRFIDHGVNAPEPWILGLDRPGPLPPQPRRLRGLRRRRHVPGEPARPAVMHRMPCLSGSTDVRPRVRVTRVWPRSRSSLTWASSREQPMVSARPGAGDPPRGLTLGPQSAGGAHTMVCWRTR